MYNADGSPVLQFQSTLPRGERQYAAGYCSSWGTYFNPRSHEGSDHANFHHWYNHHISIHAPTRGATFMAPDRNIDTLFQSTLPRGERRLFRLRKQTKNRIFQSTLPRGERHYDPDVILCCKNFNPRSHEGSDSNFRQKVLFSLSKNCLKYLILTTNYFN